VPVPLTSDEAIELAKAPLTTTTDGLTVTDRSADDIIKLDHHAAEAAAKSRGITRNPFALLRTVRLLPPGS
jgi:hypothetical protein